MSRLEKVDVGRLSPMKFESEGNLIQFRRLLTTLKIKEDEFKYWEEIILKPQQTKSKGEPSNTARFRIHPNAQKIVDDIIKEMPKGMGFTFSDAVRSALTMWAQKALVFIKDPSTRKQHLETLECLNQYKYQLDDIELKEENRRMKDKTKNVAAFNAEMTERMSQVLDRIEKKLLSFRPKDNENDNY